MLKIKRKGDSTDGILKVYRTLPQDVCTPKEWMSSRMDGQINREKTAKI